MLKVTEKKIKLSCQHTKYRIRYTKKQCASRTAALKTSEIHIDYHMIVHSKPVK